MGFEDDYFTLQFDSQIARIWQEQLNPVSGTMVREPVTTETRFDEADGDFLVLIEGLTLGASSVDLVWHEGVGDRTFVFDSFQFSTFGLRRR